MKAISLFVVLLLSSFAIAQTGIPRTERRVGERRVQVPKDIKGAAVVAHNVTVTWTASTSAGVVGYPVYRSLTTGGPYTQIAVASVTPPLKYVDTTVTAGTTYYYVVTSKDANLESGNSNQATAVVPPDPVAPNPPTNVTAVAQ